MNDLENKKALVTGAGLGIGHAICKSLAAQGADVIAVARNEETLQQLMGELPEGNHYYISADLSTEEGQQHLFQQLQSNGFPHIVVPNMHIPLTKKRIINTHKEDFENFTINIDHLYVILEKTLQFQRKEKFGRWVGITSFASTTGLPGQTIYNAQKAVVQSMFTTMATEEGKHGITANIVAPGFIHTPSVERRIPIEMVSVLSTANIVKRAGTPEDVANAVSFFASSASSFITGIMLPVCGGAQLPWMLVN